MPNLFRHLNAVEEVLHARPFGLITDVDGVIAEIAPTADQARVTPSCRESLRDLSRRLEVVAVVSGRPLDVVRRMVGVSEIEYFGNNGIEYWREGKIRLAAGAEAYRSVVAQALHQLAPLLVPLGVTLEDKGVGLALHYYQSTDPEAARAAILRAVAAAPAANALTMAETRRVIELRPSLEVTKGTAVQVLAKIHSLHGAIYLGDDVPDVDAFIAIHCLAQRARVKGLAVLVDSPEIPEEVRKHADCTLANVREVARFLRWLIRVLPDSRYSPVTGSQS